MKKLLLLLLTISFALYSQAPSTINWQGVLTDDDGNLLNGTYSITAKLYESETSSSSLWTETQTVTIAGGLANLTLGEDVAFDPIHFKEPLWLEITIGTGTPLSRIKLSAVPYAIHAKTVAGISDSDITNWNAAFGWGDHSAEGYLKSYTETDPLFSASAASTISNDNLADWNASFGWGDHAEAGYLKSYTETDPLFSASAASTISNDNLADWNASFGWGDHAEAGYLTEFDEEDPTWSGDAKINATIYRTGNTGIGTSSPNALLHTSGTGSGEGNVLFEGEYKSTSPGDPPASGAGTRMMWYPDKAAFRVGKVSNQNWDKDSIGYFSFAAGENTIASGSKSTALGYFSNASGHISTAIGRSTEASGSYSTALGAFVSAPSYAETVIGVYSKRYTPVSETSFEPDDRLFVVANGTSTYARRNALTILKSGNTGIGPINPAALLHTYGTGTGGGNVLFEGEYKSTSPGDPPASGAGTRMMWYPDKAAFRAGRVLSVNWDKDSIGNYSFATGYNTTASGNQATAMGYNSIASGPYSTAMGNHTEAQGNNSTAIGSNTSASGDNSIAMGYETEAAGDYSLATGRGTLASGEYSTAMGYETEATGEYSTSMGGYSKAIGLAATACGIYTEATGTYSISMGRYTKAIGQNSLAVGDGVDAKSYGEIAVGLYNTDYTANETTLWDENDRLFVVGNGENSVNTSNALTILKSGKTGLGTETPSELLHLSSDDNTKLRIAAGTTNIAEVNFFSGTTYKGAIGFNNTNDYLYIYQDGNLYFKDGKIGFYNISSPYYALDLPNSNITRGKGRAYAWLTYSDGRLKSERETLSYGLNEIMQIEPVQYFHHFSQKDENGILEILNEGNNDFGFIAQDMYKIIPEMVSKPEDDTNELWGMNYEKLTPVLVKAMQEQQQIIEEQNEKIEDLEKRLEALEKLLK